MSHLKKDAPACSTRAHYNQLSMDDKMAELIKHQNPKTGLRKLLKHYFAWQEKWMELNNFDLDAWQRAGKNISTQNFLQSPSPTKWLEGIQILQQMVPEVERSEGVSTCELVEQCLAVLRNDTNINRVVTEFYHNYYFYLK